MGRTLRQLISETGNYQLQAMGELEECRSIAVEMQRYRVSSFRLLEQISQEASDEEYKDQARRALNQVALLEGLLVRMATTLDQCLEHVDLAQTATLQVATLVKRR